MDFDFDVTEEAFRRRICAFLQHEITDETRLANFDGDEQDHWSPEFKREFHRRLGRAGFIGMGWPGEWGGGLSPMYQVILGEELEYHAAPFMGRSIDYIPRALIAFGTDQQRSTFVPGLRSGETTFFLGYSEPEAGSDLASLQTRAIRQGDDFVITGQKSYSSGAHFADYGWVAARTDGELPKHRGISLFIVDMTSPGIQIARHRTVAGWYHQSVYFDRVVVPGSNLVGELNGGWRVIMGAIDFERASFAAAGLPMRQIDRLLARCSQADCPENRLDDARVADLLAEQAIEVEAARLLGYWVASLQARDRSPNFESALAALYKRETARNLDALGLDILGSSAALERQSPSVQLGGDLPFEDLDHLYFQFAAGGFDINRNVIATRGLGLPRG